MPHVFGDRSNQAETGRARSGSSAPIDVAVVGIGCRFPGGASDPREFWDFLVRGGDGISDMPADRWNVERFYDSDPDAPGRMYVKRGGFLSQSLWDFDADYFGISAREAQIMDPQQRLVLEVAVEALDDAGAGPRVGGRQVGVYVGGFMADNFVGRHNPAARGDMNSHTATSGTFTMLSNRLSYVLDLQGPSMTIDTACSSSLVAIHEASQAVARGECEVALAGGVNAMLSPETFVAMCKGRFLAPDGRCKTFDADADGYARGEGAGMIVLKPLEAAHAEGDRVYAVIRATGANQDGRTSGITVPNPLAQARLARRVLAESGLQAHDIAYVEAHGTGTSIGDPLEMQALGSVYGVAEGRTRDLVVGSVKAAIGHLEAAAGVAGVIKAALTAYHGRVTPQAWLQRLNPAIPFDDYHITVPTEVRKLPGAGEQRAVAVNGFGYGGTNAHVVLTGPPAAPTPAEPYWSSSSAREVLPVSGRSEAACREQARSLRELLGADPESVRGVVAAAWGRRNHHPFRTTVSGDAAALVEGLGAVADGASAVGRAVAQDDPRPVVVFSGMGPQWWRMGRDLLQSEGVFAEVAAQIDIEFVKIAGWSIREALRAPEEDSRVSRTEVAQPANFLIQVALLAELEALGVEPAAVVGHSVGEVSAAYVSGALSLHDALLVSLHRSRLQATTAGTGGMLAVGLPESEVLSWFDPAEGRVGVAAVNSPSAVTLAGDVDVLDELAEKLTAEGVFARRLKVEVAYHSHLMDPILPEVASALAPLDPRVPSLPLWSSVTASRVTEGGAAGWGPAYWVDNVRETVRFADTVEAILEAGHRVLLEVGPHPVLAGNLREILVRRGETGAVVSTLHRDQDDATSLRTAVQGLYAAGALRTDRAPGSITSTVAQVELPGYPWQRTRLWSEPATVVDQRVGLSDSPAMLATRSASVSPQWEVELSSASLPWIPDHVVDGVTVLPGAAYLDMALCAARERTGRDTQVLADVRFRAALVFGDHDVPALRLGLDPASGRVVIDSVRGEEAATIHVTGRVVDADLGPRDHDLEVPAQAEHLAGEALYARLAGRGLDYGPTFRGVQEAWVGSERVLARVDAALGRAAGPAGHLVHPATLDAALQCVAALVGEDGSEGPVVPFAVASVRRHGDLPEEVLVSVARAEGSGLVADIAIAALDGTVLVELLGTELRPVRPARSLLDRLEPWWYEESWELTGTVPGHAARSVLGGDLVVVPIGAGPHPRTDLLLEAHPRARRIEADDLGTTLGAMLDPEPVCVVQIVLDVADTSQTDTSVATAVIAAAAAVQRVLDELLLTEGGGVPDLRGVVLVRQAFGVPGDVDEVQLAHAALIGVRRTLRNEQPVLGWRLVDAEAQTASAEIIGEVLGVEDPATGPDEVVLRGGTRLGLVFRRTLGALRAEMATPVPLIDPERSFRVEAPASQLLSDLALREVPRATPGPREIEVRLLTAGLNYKDAGKVLGLLTERELSGTYFGTALGMEAIGVVARVGEEVTEYAVGQRLSLGVRDSLARYLCVDLDGPDPLGPAPTSWADTDSALNLPFLTAHYGLVDVARVQPGETVLVHGAAGGVGLAAIQVALACGARVIGTASSPERRAAVTAAGVEEVLDSRSLDFLDRVRDLTDGAGVDVVISSAPGEIARANLEACAEFGRVVEVGKTDIYQGGQLPLAPFDRNLSFTAIDIDRLFALRPVVRDALITEVNDRFERGVYGSLPTTVYPVSALPAAFEAVIRGRHVGRVVLDFREEAPAVLPALTPARVDADASYLITGGFGDFGLATARWLAGAGARHLVLAGRSGTAGPQGSGPREHVAALQDQGVEVEEVALDVADAHAVDELVARLAGGPSPLRGIFHAAGLLEDRPFTEVDAASVDTVMRPKLVGGWHLHRASMQPGVDLDHFVVYGSASAMIGNVTQVVYAGANTSLDSLVQLRRAAGLPGLSVDWGALAGGMATSSIEVEKYLAAIGLGSIDLDLAAQMLGAILGLPSVRQVGVIDADWARWAATHPLSAGSPRVADLVAEAAAASSESAALAAELSALPEHQRADVVALMLAEQLAVVLGVPAETVDLETPLSDLGMDSLMAVEMQARINVALGVEMSALELTRGGGLAAVAGRLLPDLLGVEEVAP